ncbi:hypothetical protein Bca101_039342 [Brassica carinata]
MHNRNLQTYIHINEALPFDSAEQSIEIHRLVFASENHQDREVPGFLGGGKHRKETRRLPSSTRVTDRNFTADTMRDRLLASERIETERKRNRRDK